MGKYRAMFHLGLQNTVIYRWNFLFRSLTGLIPLFGGLFLWRALYQSRDGNSIEGFGYSEIICYFLYVLVAENLITPVEDEWQIATDIRDGRQAAKAA